MNKNKVVDFSNIYSAKSQQILSKGRSLVSNLSKTQRFSPDTFSHSKSPKSAKKFITNIPTIEGYKQKSKLTFADERVNQINGRLQIDTEIQRNYQHRVKNQQFYFNDTYNPITEAIKQTPVKQDSTVKQDKSKNRITIISELQRLKQDITIKMISKKLQKNISPIKDCLEMLQAQRLKRAKEKSKKFDKILTFQVRVEEQAKISKSQLQILEDLVQTKEQSYFNKRFKQNPRNIFNLVKNYDHPDFRSNKEILDSLYFNLDSIVTISLSQKQKFPTNCIDQISSFARTLMKNVKPKKMPQKMILTSGDLNLNMEKLQFDEMMLITTNKLPSSVLLQYFRQEDLSMKKPFMEENQEKFIVSDAINYGSTKKNRMDNYNIINQDRTQVKYYGNSELNPLEAAQRQLTQTFKQQFKALIQEEAIIKNKTIRDKGVFNRFNKKKDRILLDQLQANADGRMSNLMMEVQRKIRMFKISKNRTQKIKVNQMTQTLKMKKILEQTLIKGKNKSPLNTWR